MKFVTIGYGSREDYERTPQTVRDEAHAHDQRLRAAGVDMGMAGTPVQVRNPENTGRKVEEGAFLRADLPIAGFAIIEAESLDDAVAMVANTPCAVAHGVVEVWPLEQR
ncbi:YciI family protein [Lentzea sp. NPDC051838]|uniref:YciI family protein n=1 Tax=Lentzea sp. NPDC051838 TaxID=3154849 RepID=UPI003434CF53